MYAVVAYKRMYTYKVEYVIPILEMLSTALHGPQLRKPVFGGLQTTKA